MERAEISLLYGISLIAFAIFGIETGVLWFEAAGLLSGLAGISLCTITVVAWIIVVNRAAHEDIDFQHE